MARTKIKDLKIIKEKNPKQGKESANFERVRINSCPFYSMIKEISGKSLGFNLSFPSATNFR
jgi:hypothetical protein